MVCIELLLQTGASVDHRNEHGNTALMWAARCGHTSCVELLLRKGASINNFVLIGTLLYFSNKTRAHKVH